MKTNVKDKLDRIKENGMCETYFDNSRVTGWYPITIDRLKCPENLEKYVKNGIIREVDTTKNEIHFKNK